MGFLSLRRQAVFQLTFHWRADIRGGPSVSKFGYLTAAQFAAGLRQLRLDASAEPAEAPEPVSERYDVLVLAKS